MQEQDEDVDVLAGAVRRQKELGIQIQQELEVQKDLLGLLDEDVGRVGEDGCGTEEGWEDLMMREAF